MTAVTLLSPAKTNEVQHHPNSSPQLRMFLAVRFIYFFTGFPKEARLQLSPVTVDQDACLVLFAASVFLQKQKQRSAGVKEPPVVCARWDSSSLSAA